MNAMELLTTRRTYRRFAQKAVPQDVVDDIVQAVRLSSCGANRQAVRLVLAQCRCRWQGRRGWRYPAPTLHKRWAARLPWACPAPAADSQPI